MKGKNTLRKRMVFSGLTVLIGFFMMLSTAYADIIDHERPGWWDIADARLELLLPNFTYADIQTPVVADGSKGYTYTTHFNTTAMPPFFSSTSLTVDLENEENPNKTKLFWVGVHFIGHFNPFANGYILPDESESFVDIIGKYNNGSQTGTLGYDYFKVDADPAGSGWAYFGASLFPQPAREEFNILVDTFFLGIPAFQIDRIEIGTYCVPIPSALLLFGGGLAGLVGLKRRKQK